MRAKRSWLFSKSSPLRRRRKDILFFGPDADEEREMREHYAAAAAEDNWKRRLRELKLEEEVRKKELADKATEDSERVLFLYMFKDDCRIDSESVETQIGKIDKLRRGSTCIVELRKARRMTRELHEEFKDMSGAQAEHIQGRLERRLTKINKKIDRLPDTPHLQCAA